MAKKFVCMQKLYFYLPPARRVGDYKTHSVSVCVTFLKRPVHHTGCFSLAFSMFYDLIATFDVNCRKLILGRDIG